MPSFQFDAIGTTWQIDVVGANSIRPLQEKIQSRIEQFDKTYSRFRSDSLVTKIAQQAGGTRYCAPTDAKPLLTLYQELNEKTNGLFTPLIGQVLVNAGYDEKYSFQEKKLTQPKALQEVLTYQHPHLTMKEPALLDFGAAGKGYLIDIIGELLETNGITSYCIDAGGDILYKINAVGAQYLVPLRVGLEDPENTKQVIGVVPITNQSICASAGNRRKWKQFHHIFNPHLLNPVDTILATWVIAKTALLADALATCLFLVSPETLQAYDFEYLILYPDYTIRKSRAFQAELFLRH